MGKMSLSPAVINFMFYCAVCHVYCTSFVTAFKLILELRGKKKDQIKFTP